MEREESKQKPHLHQSVERDGKSEWEINKGGSMTWSAPVTIAFSNRISR